MSEPRSGGREGLGGSDADLMAEVSAGRLECLGELFERHHRPLYAFLLRMTGEAAAAEDLVQDVFLRVLRYRRSFRAGAPFEPWLYTLARNAASDHFRRRGAAPLGGDRPDERPSPLPGTDREAAGRQSVGLLRQAFGRLTTDQRELLVLARFEGRPYADIAERLGCSVGAVKVRVHRAARRLGELYGDLSEEGAT